MPPIEAALALACILSPEPVEQPPCSPTTLKAVALSMELMDNRECRYMFTRAADVKLDLNLIHERYKKLRDAPPLCDADRWPEREQTRELIRINRAYVAWLEERKPLFSNDTWIDAAIEDAKHLQSIYELVSDSRCEYYYCTVRRKALLDLRSAIGPHAYYSGTLPPIVPVWFFRRIEE